MLLHDIRIAAKSLKRNRVLSTLTIAGVALGIALSTTFAAVRHAFARNPVSHKEAVLRYVRLDSWDPERAYPSLDDPKSLPTQITYRDMTELMRSKIPIRQTGLFKTSFYVFPEGESARPFQQETRLCFRDFFAMFDVPFRYGSAWDAKADTGGEPVVVLSEEMNDRLFGGANSVGKTLKLADKDFRVVGVLAHYRPNIRIYDMTQNQIVPTEGLFAPFNLVRPMQLRSIGNLDGWGPSPATPGFEGFLQSEAAWIQFWVELPDAAAHAAYAEFLKGYILEQKKHGRFLRPLNYRLSSPSDLIRDFKAVPKEMNALLVVSLLFLAVCSVNLVGLLLGKFLARSNEVAVRRALGASRLDVFVQHVVETELIGVVGGVLGIALSASLLLVLNGVVKLVANRSDLFRLDLPMLGLSVLLSLGAGLLAGVYPAWRVCRIAPATLLKG